MPKLHVLIAACLFVIIKISFPAMSVSQLASRNGKFRNPRFEHYHRRRNDGNQTLLPSSSSSAEVGITNATATSIFARALPIKAKSPQYPCELLMKPESGNTTLSSRAKSLRADLIARHNFNCLKRIRAKVMADELALQSLNATAPGTSRSAAFKLVAGRQYSPKSLHASKLGPKSLARAGHSDRSDHPSPIRIHVVDDFFPRATSVERFVIDEVVPQAVAEISKRMMIKRPTQGKLLLPVQKYNCYTILGKQYCSSIDPIPEEDHVCWVDTGMRYQQDLFEGYELCEWMTTDCVSIPAGGCAGSRRAQCKKSRTFIAAP